MIYAFWIPLGLCAVVAIPMVIAAILDEVSGK